MANLSGCNEEDSMSMFFDTSVYAKVLISVGYVALILVTVLGNVLVMMAYAKDEKIRKRVANLIIFNLAIADFVVGICILPGDFLVTVYSGEWVLGIVACQAWMFIDYTSVAMSIAMIVLISLDRYWLITRTIRYRSTQTRGRVRKMIAACWLIIGVGFSVMTFAWEPLKIGRDNLAKDRGCIQGYLESSAAGLATSVLTAFIPLLATAAINVTIFVSLWRHSQRFIMVKMAGMSQPDQTRAPRDARAAKTRQNIYVMAQMPPETRPSAGSCDHRAAIEAHRARIRRNVRAACRLSVVVVIFAACLLPIEILSACYAMGIEINDQAWRVASLIQWFNSGINPMLYAATNKRFRQNFRHFLHI